MLYPETKLWQNADFLLIQPDTSVMSYILALDSSSDACSVALIKNGDVTSLFELAAKSHTQRLLPMVDEILRQTGCELKDLDAISFGRGPGSFTGLRICLGVVQGLAFGLQIPVIPVSTLAAIAAGYYYSHQTTANEKNSAVLVALDARMNEVYWGLFQQNSSSRIPDSLTPEFVMPPAAVITHDLVQQHRDQLVGVGPGWHYPELQVGSDIVIECEVYPHAKDIVRLAAELFAHGETVAVMDAQPVYLRDQVSWQKRQRIRTEKSL